MTTRYTKNTSTRFIAVNINWLYKVFFLIIDGVGKKKYQDCSNRLIYIVQLCLYIYFSSFSSFFTFIIISLSSQYGMMNSITNYLLKTSTYNTAIIIYATMPCIMVPALYLVNAPYGNKIPFSQYSNSVKFDVLIYLVLQVDLLANLELSLAYQENGAGSLWKQYLRLFTRYHFY
jgi:hypothetical protein